MKVRGTLVFVFILLSFPSFGESLAGYYLRFASNQNILDSLFKIVYVFCGLGSLFNLVLVYQKLLEGDHQAYQRARQWCLSLFLVAACTFVVSGLIADYRAASSAQLATVLGEAADTFKVNYTVFSKVVFVSCGIIGLLVLPEKFHALQSGDRYAGKSLANWGLGLIAVSAIVYIINLMYLKP